MNTITLALVTAKAIIFDLDGVIVATEPLKFRAYQHVFKAVYYIELPETEVEWRGMKEEAVIHFWFRKFNLTGNCQKLIEAKRQAYRDLLKITNLNTIKGIKNFLQVLKIQQKKCALATSSNRLDALAILTRLNLEVFFDSIKTGDDVTLLKPSPQIYLETAQELQVQPKDCLVFEDSPSGIQAAKAAEMVCIGVTTSFSPDQLALADYTISDFSQLSFSTKVV
jgi:beta-phosphoglucomutase